MRKLIYFLAFFIALQVTVHAQKVRGGIKAGVAMSKYTGVGESVHERSGPDLGVFWNMDLGKYFGFQPAFNFWVQKGFNQTQTILNSTTTTTTLKVNCFEAQLNFILHTPGQKFRLFIGGGPSASMAVNGKWTRRTASTTDKLDVKFGKAQTDDLKKGEFGVTGLAGISWGGLMVMACYNHGITDLNPKNGEDVIQSSYIGLSLGFLLPFQQMKK